MNDIFPVKINNIPSKAQKPDFRYVNFGKAKTDRYETQYQSRAVSLGLDLYNSPPCAFKRIIKNSMPDVSVIFINDPESGIDADLAYNHGKSFTPFNFRLHSSYQPKTFRKGSKILYALAFAHEYTHYQQLTSKKYNNSIRNLAGSDYEYLCRLSPIGCGIFDELDQEKFGFDGKIFGLRDKISERIYSVPLPRKKSFNNSDILAAKKMKTKEEFKKYILDKFDKVFDRTIEIILTEPGSADEKILNFVKNIVQDEEKLQKFKNDVKALCVIKARHEKEAYGTECSLARKILKTDSRLNIDFYVAYFSMLEKALS